MEDISVSSPASDVPKKTPERGWLHWGLLVGALYLAVSVVITLPFLWACFYKTGDRNPLTWDVYKEWPYWTVIGFILLGQFLLLRVPVRLATQRPVSRSSVWLPIIVSGFCFALLSLGLFCTLVELFKVSGVTEAWIILTVLGVSWVAWALVFADMTSRATVENAVALQSRWMLRGSILELLVAVPSHIVARGRSDCCAGFLTFIGLTTGLSVMLLSFGPAVFLLYYARWRRLKKAT
jgi:hypothetical protein